MQVPAVVGTRKRRRLCALLARNQRRNAVACPPHRETGEAIGQEVAEDPSGARPHRGVVRQVQAAGAAEKDTVGGAAGRRDPADRCRGRIGDKIGPGVVSFDADDQILPLRIVADKTAAVEGAVASSAQHRPLGRSVHVFKGSLAQAEMHQRLCRVGKVCIGFVVTELAAEIETAPAREGRRAHGCHRG